MKRATPAATLAMLACTALLPAATAASDTDDDPPYMIYIDPETGKYTTRDPAQSAPVSEAASMHPDRTSDPGPAGSQLNLYVAVPLLAIAAALAAFVIRRARKP